MTEKMPSSTILGVLPSLPTIILYSLSVRPCSFMTEGVIFMGSQRFLLFIFLLWPVFISVVDNVLVLIRILSQEYKFSVICHSIITQCNYERCQSNACG